MEILLVILGIINLALIGVLVFKISSEKKEKIDFSEITEKLVKTDTKIEMLSKKVEEIQPRIATEFRENRKEISGNLGEIQKTVDNKLTRIQDSNEKKLEQMRETVDEKLKESVEKRFDETFKTHSGPLTQVHQGLGEMKNLATGVGDLKTVREGVKTRGIYGEVQLGAIISDILTPAQYLENTLIKKGSNDRVEFAIKMPGKEAEVLLPIDSKFPVENYSRLIAAYDKGEKEEVEKYRRELAKDVKEQAKKISTKYIEPPKTLDFAMMFLPTESLYAEVLRIPALVDEVRQKYNISIASPATLPVMLNGLLMGYRSVAIEKRSAEVWKILGGVKAQFSKFGDLLEGVQKKLTESANKIESAKTTSRQIERKLKDVETISEGENLKLLED